jgi:hypothetical protein
MIPKTKNPKPEMALRLQKKRSEASAKRLISALEFRKILFLLFLFHQADSKVET